MAPEMTNEEILNAIQDSDLTEPMKDFLATLVGLDDRAMKAEVTFTLPPGVDEPVAYMNELRKDACKQLFAFLLNNGMVDFVETENTLTATLEVVKPLPSAPL